ncbi:MAG TPA: hypothetical protein VFZ27_17215 [Terriglobia bacterium]|nr:hypothetical protein [Terriglobia bacterium]
MPMRQTSSKRWGFDFQVQGPFYGRGDLSFSSRRGWRSKRPGTATKSGDVWGLFGGSKNKKNTFFQKQSGEVAENKGSARKANGNKPENKAEKLLKTRACGKNKPKTNRKNNPAMLLKRLAS